MIWLGCNQSCKVNFKEQEINLRKTPFIQASNPPSSRIFKKVALLNLSHLAGLHWKNEEDGSCGSAFVTQAFSLTFFNSLGRLKFAAYRFRRYKRTGGRKLRIGLFDSSLFSNFFILPVRIESGAFSSLTLKEQEDGSCGSAFVIQAFSLTFFIPSFRKF